MILTGILSNPSAARSPSRSTRAFLRLALLLVLLGPALGDAQGFRSVSSPSQVATEGAAPPPAGSVTTSSASPATEVPAVIGPVAAPVATTEALPPAAQLASLAVDAGEGGAVASVGAPSFVSPAAPGTRYGSSGGSFEQADKVLVDKSDRRLYLLKQDRVIAEYQVKLGLNPYGHKQQEGDFRTPEGRYHLTRRNPRSEFFLAIQVSYPNREDNAWAKENGWEPGGLIMIHGQPNVPKRSTEFYAKRDWTDGCIALSNADMVDVWLRTASGLPIEIRP